MECVSHAEGPHWPQASHVPSSLVSGTLPWASAESPFPGHLPSSPAAPAHIPIEDLAVFVNLVRAVLVRHLALLCVRADVGREVLALGGREWWEGPEGSAPPARGRGQRGAAVWEGKVWAKCRGPQAVWPPWRRGSEGRSAMDGPDAGPGQGSRQGLTFTRILPLSICGEGSRVASSLLTDDKSSLSPRMSVRYWAIFFCWATLQWFSMDRTTGYLRPPTWGEQVRPGQGPHHWTRRGSPP